MSVIPFVYLSLILIFISYIYLIREHKINYLFIAIFAAFFLKIYYLLPQEFLYFKLDKIQLIFIFVYTCIVIFYQSRIRSFLVPAIYFLSITAFIINNLIPFFFMFELIFIAIYSLIFTKSTSKLKGHYISIHSFLSLLTGILLMFSIISKSEIFVFLFLIVLILRSGLFPLWLIEKNIFKKLPFVFSFVFVTRQFLILSFISKSGLFIGHESWLYLSSFILYISLFSLIVAGILINNIKDPVNLYATSLLIIFSFYYILLVLDVSYILHLLCLLSVALVSFVSPRIFSYYKNKSKIHSFEVDAFNMYNTTSKTFTFLLVLMLIPFPFSPLIIIEYSLLTRFLETNAVYLITLLLIGATLYKIAGIKILSKILSRGEG